MNSVCEIYIVRDLHSSNSGKHSLCLQVVKLVLASYPKLHHTNYLIYITNLLMLIPKFPKSVSSMYKYISGAFTLVCGKLKKHLLFR